MYKQRKITLVKTFNSCMIANTKVVKVAKIYIPISLKIRFFLMVIPVVLDDIVNAIINDAQNSPAPYKDPILYDIPVG